MRKRNKSLKVILLYLVITSLPIHLMLNCILGYVVHPVTNITGHAGLALKYPEALNETSISLKQCASYLLSSVAFVTDYSSITAILTPEAEAANRVNYEMYANGTGGYVSEQFTPSSNDIVTCYIYPVESTCDLTARWFPLIARVTAVSIKSLTAYIPLRRHSHFPKIAGTGFRQC
jgi:hypothetical protein